MIEPRRNTRILSNIIDDVILKDDDAPRNYIGASSIGDSCERKLWYQYNKYPRDPFTQQQQRTFSIGKRLESLVLDYLSEAGLCITRSELLNEVVCDDIEQFRGHMDAIWHTLNQEKIVIEVKTAKDSSFQIFKNKGLKTWNSTYYAQAQAYMGMMGAEKAFVIALNKDTSELFDEMVVFDEMYYEGLKGKVRSILEAEVPPVRINNDRFFYLCRNCGFKTTCHARD